MCGSGELSKRPSQVSSVSGRSWLPCQWDQRCSIFCHLAIQQNHLESDHGLGDCTAVCLRSKDNVEVQDINHETEKQKSNDVERLLLTIRHAELPDREPICLPLLCSDFLVGCHVLPNASLSGWGTAKNKCAVVHLKLMRHSFRYLSLMFWWLKMCCGSFEIVETFLLMLIFTLSLWGEAGRHMEVGHHLTVFASLLW